MTQHSLSVLVLDDDPVDAAILSRTLERIGSYSVDIATADSLDGAYALAESRCFDLYLVDYETGDLKEVFVDASGAIVRVHVGELHEEQATEFLAELL